MIGFQIVGIVTCVSFFIAGTIWLASPCDADHDTIARQGADKCPKCNEEL